MIIKGDNLEELKKLPDEIIDLVYLDPPFNSNRNYLTYKDKWNKEDYQHHNLLSSICDFAGTHHSESMKTFLSFIGARLIEIKRIQKEKSSIFLHCDGAANYYLRILMDFIFGKNNFRNEIVWCYTGPSFVKRKLPPKHDTILFYSWGEAIFNADTIRVPYKQKFTLKNTGNPNTSVIWKNRKTRPTQEYIDNLNAKGKIMEDYWTDIATAVNSKERTGYPTQKPLKLTKRIINLASNEGDLVMDPFCGSGSFVVAAKELNRKYIGIDQNETAIKITKERLND